MLPNYEKAAMGQCKHKTQIDSVFFEFFVACGMNEA